VRARLLLKPFVRSETFGENYLKLAAPEGTFMVLRSVAPSFRSMDCTSKLIQCVFEPNISRARTKAEIVLIVLTPFSLAEFQSSIRKPNFTTDPEIPGSIPGATTLSEK
jgi:hypothetical protein